MSFFLDSSRRELRGFPQAARQDAGYQLDRVQRGEEPTDWKPMKLVGAGVKEIRIHAEGEHRVVYVAKFAEAVYVLRAFEKKTQKTTKKDTDLARKRYQALLAARSKL